MQERIYEHDYVREISVAKPPIICYNNYKSNRILEYPGRRKAGRKPYTRRGKVSFGMESFHAFSVCRKIAYYGVKIGG